MNMTEFEKIPTPCYIVDEENDVPSLVGEYAYSYDAEGRLTSFFLKEDGSVKYIYTFSNYTLCYEGGLTARERISIINQTHIDSITAFFD